VLKELDNSRDANEDCLESPGKPPGRRTGRDPAAGSSPVRTCSSGEELCKET